MRPDRTKEETEKMDEVFNVGKTLLLDGQPMSLVTPAGVEAWIDQGIK